MNVPLPRSIIPSIQPSPYLALAPEDWPSVEHLVIEDGAPVDSILSEKLMRLLTEALYASWLGPAPGRPFLALANVGLFSGLALPPLVPDVMLSLDVQAAEDFSRKENRSYFVWIFGKFPDVTIEIVSNREGGEDTTKLEAYARMGIPYYVIYDPLNLLGGGVLRVFGLNRRRYEAMPPDWFEDIGLGLTLWQGTFEGSTGQWLRWCDRQGQVLPTGAERAALAEQRAETAEQKALRLADQLRALGIEPAE